MAVLSCDGDGECDGGNNVWLFLFCCIAQNQLVITLVKQFDHLIPTARICNDGKLRRASLLLAV